MFRGDNHLADAHGLHVLVVTGNVIRLVRRLPTARTKDALEHNRRIKIGEHFTWTVILFGETQTARVPQSARERVIVNATGDTQNNHYLTHPIPKAISNH